MRAEEADAAKPCTALTLEGADPEGVSSQATSLAASGKKVCGTENSRHFWETLSQVQCEESFETWLEQVTEMMQLWQVHDREEVAFAGELMWPCPVHHAGAEGQQ